MSPATMRMSRNWLRGRSCLCYPQVRSCPKKRRSSRTTEWAPTREDPRSNHRGPEQSDPKFAKQRVQPHNPEAQREHRHDGEVLEYLDLAAHHRRELESRGDDPASDDQHHQHYQGQRGEELPVVET